MLRYCANLKAIRYESTSLNRTAADKSHCVIVAEGYALSDTFYRIEIEPLIFKLCSVLFGYSFSKLTSRCSSERKSESP